MHSKSQKHTLLEVLLPAVLFRKGPKERTPDLWESGCRMHFGMRVPLACLRHRYEKDCKSLRETESGRRRKAPPRCSGPLLCRRFCCVSPAPPAATCTPLSTCKRSQLPAKAELCPTMFLRMGTEEWKTDSVRIVFAHARANHL